MKETIVTQILLGFLLEHYVVSIDKISLKSEKSNENYIDFIENNEIQLKSQRCK